MKKPLLTLVILSALLGFACRENGGAPYIFLITVDTLRADHLGCYGYQERTSPTMNLLAQKGARFERAFTAAPWGLPAYASLFTGVYPSAHGAVEEGTFVKKDLPRLADLLRRHGYTTVGFAASPVLAKERGFGEGFDRYFPLKSSPAEILVDRAMEWLKENRKERFFFFLEFADPQAPYTPPVEYAAKHYPPGLPPIKGGLLEILGVMDLWPSETARAGLKALRSLYDAQIDATDAALGKLYEVIQNRRLDRDAIIILTSPNGEEFMEHGLMGHGVSLYNEQIRIPLIVYGPRRVPEGLVVKENASLVDLMPTILDLAGVEAPEGLAGRSLMPLVDANPSEASASAKPGFADRAIFSETTKIGPDRLCVIRGKYKYISSPEYSLNGASFGRNLFDLDKDPEEKTDLLAGQPELAAPFEEIIRGSGLYERRLLWSVLFGKSKGPAVYSGVLSTSGEFATVYKHAIAYGSELNKIVSKDYVLFRTNRTLRFAAVSSEEMNGVHFIVEPPDAMVELTLLQNGKKIPRQIALGCEGRFPDSEPFYLQSREDGAPRNFHGPGYEVFSQEVWGTKGQGVLGEMGESLPPSTEFVNKLRALVHPSDKGIEETLRLYLTGQGEEP